MLDKLIKWYSLVMCFLLWVVFSSLAVHAGGKYNFKVTPYVVSSGAYNGFDTPSGNAVKVWQKMILSEYAPWLRLRFGNTILGSDSYLLVTSMKDGAEQKITREILKEWRNTSACPRCVAPSLCEKSKK